MVSGSFGDRYLPDSPRSGAASSRRARRRRTRRSARPTRMRRPEQLRQHLDRDQLRLYELIWLRFVAGQMAPAVFDTTTADFDLQRRAARSTCSARPARSWCSTASRDSTRKRGRRAITARSTTSSRCRTWPRRIAARQRDRARAALHAAAAALHGGEPGQGAGAARHRPAVHVRADHLDADGPRVRQARAEALPRRHRSARPSRPCWSGSSPTCSASTSPAAWKPSSIASRRASSTGARAAGLLHAVPARLARAPSQSQEIIRDTVAGTPARAPSAAATWPSAGTATAASSAAPAIPSAGTRSRSTTSRRPSRSRRASCARSAAPAMIERDGRFGPFIACSNYPKCKHTKPRTIPA
jgi:hypothetical protein